MRNPEHFAMISALANAVGELEARRESFLSQYQIVKDMVTEACTKGVDTELITAIVDDAGSVTNG